MGDWATKALEVLKLSPRVLLALVAATAFLLFAPASVLTRIGLRSLVEAHRAWLGGGLVISGALFLSYVGQGVVDLVRGWIEATIEKRRLKARLRKLTPREKALLKFCVDRQSRSLMASLQDGDVLALQHEKIVYRSSNVGHFDSFTFNVQPWAWDELAKDPSLLDGAEQASLSRFG